jgi:hypothetical protein
MTQNPRLRLAAFAAALPLPFGGAALAGAAIDPHGEDPTARTAEPEHHMTAGDARPGREADLHFTITRGGVPVKTEPYLGAGGHLVALREGDMAFLHVHSMDDGVRFAAKFPTGGRYRLFLQFQHEGRVQTVAFTHEVA